MLSPKIENIALSGTMAISAKTIEMQEAGIHVIDLCVGESDLNTPDFIKKAAVEAISNNKTRYTLNKGITELRAAIAEKFKNDYNAEYNLNEIIVSNGAKQAVYNSLQAIISDEDEVILPLPYYVSYLDMIKLAGGIPVLVETKIDNSYKMTAEEFKGSITPKSKAVLICNPNNPTGSLYEYDEIKSLLEIAYDHNVVVIADEIYESFIYDIGTFTSFSSFGNKFKDITIIINGVSKAYAMTGWRIGWAAAPEQYIQGMNKLQSHSTSNACSISQYAALAALKGDQTSVEQQRKIYAHRKEIVNNLLAEINELNFIDPKGAFYFFVDIRELIEKIDGIENSSQFCLTLLDKAHVATVPGTVFGMEGFMRISYAKSEDDLKEAFKRIKKFIADFA